MNRHHVLLSFKSHRQCVKLKLAFEHVAHNSNVSKLIYKSLERNSPFKLMIVKVE